MQPHLIYIHTLIIIIIYMHSQPIMHTHSSIERFVRLYNSIGQYDQITCTAKSDCCKQLLNPICLDCTICKYGCFALLELISAVHSQICKIYNAVIHTNGCANIICMYTYTTHTIASQSLTTVSTIA